MPHTLVGLPARHFLETRRRDAWWVAPLTVLLVLSAFIVYSTWAAFQGAYYEFGPYLSPFYSPLIFGESEHAWFRGTPQWLPISPAFLILWAPGGFRLTCYYYRGAYYKAFWADPPSCTVGEPRKSYLGERSFPLILQNVHRYFLYLALLFLVFLAHDVWKALWFTNATTGAREFGVGVGTLVLALNVGLLASYTLGCHSLRHLIGGRLAQLSKQPLQQRSYVCVSALNRRHMLFAWLSLFGVAFADLYIRMCALGIWHDVRLI
ncbi:MAG: succinate dehydrogenase [Gemmatimonadota bacterium]